MLLFPLPSFYFSFIHFIYCFITTLSRALLLYFYIYRFFFNFCYTWSQECNCSPLHTNLPNAMKKNLWPIRGTHTSVGHVGQLNYIKYIKVIGIIIKSEDWNRKMSHLRTTNVRSLSTFSALFCPTSMLTHQHAVANPPAETLRVTGFRWTSLQPLSGTQTLGLR